MTDFSCGLTARWLAIGVATALLGCAQTTTTPPSFQASADESSLTTSAENLIRRDAGKVRGKAHVAVLQMDAESTSSAMRSLNR